MSEEVNNEANAADDAQVASDDAAATPKVEDEKSSTNQVPVRELQKERRERQRLEKELADFQQKQDEARQAELSEVERLKEQLEKVKGEAAQAAAARVLAEQQSLVRTAASNLGFADINDAITFVNFETLKGLEGQELADAVADEVKRVSEDKPYLLTTTESKKSVGKASDREGADEPPATGEDALGGFVHGLLFGKK